nr:MAG TPA: hypothetical protein [Caudoviricetes sp.]
MQLKIYSIKGQGLNFALLIVCILIQRKYKEVK